MLLFLSMNISAGNKVKLEIIFRFLAHSNPVTVRSCWKSVSTSPGQSASFNCHPPITLSLIGIAFQLGNISERTRLKLLSLLCKKNIPCRSKSYICSILREAHAGITWGGYEVTPSRVYLREEELQHFEMWGYDNLGHAPPFFVSGMDSVYKWVVIGQWHRKAEQYLKFHWEYILLSE